MFAKKSTSSNLNDARGRWDIHDDMTFKVIRGQGQSEEMTSVPYWDFLQEEMQQLTPWALSHILI